jgi:signal transduction histidine kinase
LTEASGTGSTGEDLDAALRDVALHNLRTPLSVAEGAVTLLRDHGDRLTPTQRADLFASIESAHRRIRHMAESALADRYPPPEGVARPAEVKPRDIVDSVIVDLRDAGPVRLEGIIDDAVPSSFAGDPRTVRDAVENLVTNAIKFTPEGGTVTVVAKADDGVIRFEVTDEGPGIPADRQDALFTGQGRGLVLVRRLVEGQGGTLGVQSQLGHGSTFWVTFPANTK